METLPEAHERSTEQSQPPETCAKNDYGEIAEEKSSVPVRQHFVLSNARYLSLPVSLSFIAQGGRPLSSVYITLILCPFGQRYSSILSLPNTCYLGFDSPDLYLPIHYTTKGVPTCKACLHTLYTVCARGWFSTRHPPPPNRASTGMRQNRPFPEKTGPCSSFLLQIAIRSDPVVAVIHAL